LILKLTLTPGRSPVATGAGWRAGTLWVGRGEGLQRLNVSALRYKYFVK
jgi:hypothetical protein